MAGERLNDGLLGAGAGAIVGGPVGAAAGGAIGYVQGRRFLTTIIAAITITTTKAVERRQAGFQAGPDVLLPELKQGRVAAISLRSRLTPIWGNAHVVSDARSRRDRCGRAQDVARKVKSLEVGGHIHADSLWGSLSPATGSVSDRRKGRLWSWGRGWPIRYRIPAYGAGPLLSSA